MALRQPGLANGRASAVTTGVAPPRGKAMPGSEPAVVEARRVAVHPPGAALMMGRTHVGGFEGSPLDPRYTFDSFVVGPANRMAHAAATQVADTVLAEERGFNPLYLHASVGLGKTHLQHAIAWEVKRRTPKASVLYLTAERFRYQFVEAVKSQDAMAFKDKFRTIDILLIDDLEFMRGEKTEQEFEHIINSLLDGGRQVVVASARPPVQLDGLNDRMRSRLQRGLITEISPMDAGLRLKVLEKRAQEKRAIDPSFELPDEVVALLADRLTESGRELEGAINRLYLTWQLMHAPVTLDIAETIIRDLVQGIEPGASRSRTSCASSRGISPCPSRTSSRSAGIAPWCARGRSACIWPSTSPPGRCRRSAGASATATTPRCCMRSARSTGRSARIPGSRTRSRS